MTVKKVKNPLFLANNSKMSSTTTFVLLRNNDYLLKIQLSEAFG